MENKCCDNPNILEQMIAWSPQEDEKGREHSHDPNRRRCSNCNKVWFIPCWCGWTVR